MWQQLVECAADRQVAFCIPLPEAIGGPAFPIFWYGILAALGILVGATYARWHVDREGEDPDLIWDLMLWVLPMGLLGGRLWYVGQAVLIDGSTAYSFSRPFEIIWPRFGGMNIIGGALFAVIGALIFFRIRKGINTWVIADAGLMGLFIGHAIGRIGNLVNIELYGPPTGSDTFGILVPAEHRLAQFAALPPETRFHPTMLYEAAWLTLCFGVLVYLFWRYQEKFKPGIFTALYLTLAGFGRFFFEFYRPDQPRLDRFVTPGTFLATLSFSQFMSVLYFLVGLILLFNRLGQVRLRFIGIGEPVSDREREKHLEAVGRERRRRERTREREKAREERRRSRARQREEAKERLAADSNSSTGEEAVETPAS